MSGLRETVNVIKTVQHQAHRGVGDLILPYLVAITAEIVKILYSLHNVFILHF